MSNLLDPVARYVRLALERHAIRDHLDLWTGQVITVDTTNKRATVKLRAEAVATTCQYMSGPSDYLPVVGEYVYVLVRNRSYLILGKATLV